MQHAAEITAFRNDKTKSPICWRYKNMIKIKCVLVRTQGSRTELIMPKKKGNSYQFCVFKIP